MKIAVYCIAKNEAKFAERFVNAVRDADLILIADTGSTDDTVQLLRDAGARVYNVNIHHFRFDHARNVAMELLPSDIDICVSLDLDEIPEPGWREAIEKAWTPGTTALRYLFHWSHHADGTPDISFWPSKVHARHGYRWEYPVHEVLAAEIPEVVRDCDMIVHHWPDSSKSRGGYLPLLELSVKERPDNHRASLYLGREYMYAERWGECATQLQRYLTIPSATWYLERCAAMRFIARSFVNLGDKGEALRWYLRACAEAWDQREPWIELGNHYFDASDMSGAYYAATQALKINERPASYLTEAWAWNHWPEKLQTLSLRTLENNSALARTA